MNGKDVEKVYGTLMCSPGMEVMVKLDSKISRTAVLLLSQVVARGLAKSKNEDQFSLIELSDEQSLQELKTLVATALESGGLTALDQMLSGLQHPASQSKEANTPNGYPEATRNPRRHPAGWRRRPDFSGRFYFALVC